VRVHHDAGAPRPSEAAQALRDALGNLTSVPFRPPGPHSIVDAVAESPDGAWFATGQRNGAVTLWSTADPRSPHVLLAPGDHPSAPSPSAPPASPPCATNAAARTSGRSRPHLSLQTSNLSAGTSPSPTSTTSRGAPTAPPCSPASAPRADGPRARRPPDPPRGRPRPRPPRPHRAAIHHALWSPDGGAILSAASDATARLWPPNGPTRVRTHKRPPSAVAFAQDGRSYAVAADRSIDIIPVGPGRPRRLTHAAPLLGLAFTAGGDLVTAHSDSKVRQWDPADGTSFSSELLHLHEVLGGVRFADDADLLLGTPDGGAAYLWQRATAPAPRWSSTATAPAS
jgi:WD40 repeat protein